MLGHPLVPHQTLTHYPFLATFCLQKSKFLSIGRVGHGFAFLGYRLNSESEQGLEVAWKTVSNHLEKIARLSEQGAGVERIGEYLKGWWQWVNAGVDVMVDRAAELWALVLDKYSVWDDAQLNWTGARAVHCR